MFYQGLERTAQAGKVARIAIGQTRAGRYLRVVYVLDPEPKSIFVITAFDLIGKPLMAYKRRSQKKK